MHNLTIESRFSYHNVMGVSTNSFVRIKDLHTHDKNRMSYKKCHIGMWGESPLTVSNWLLSYCEYNADEHD